MKQSCMKIPYWITKRSRTETEIVLTNVFKQIWFSDFGFFILFFFLFYLNLYASSEPCAHLKTT